MSMKKRWRSQFKFSSYFDSKYKQFKLSYQRVRRLLVLIQSVLLFVCLFLTRGKIV